MQKLSRLLYELWFENMLYLYGQIPFDHMLIPVSVADPGRPFPSSFQNRSRKKKTTEGDCTNFVFLGFPLSKFVDPLLSKLILKMRYIKLLF